VSDAAEHSWVQIKDATDRIEMAFPHQPNEMNFDLPSKGHLHVYTCATPSSVFLFTTLDLPSINEQTLNEKEFKRVFETVLAPRLFYYPQLFQHQQTYQAEKGAEGLHFLFSFMDSKEKRLVKGFAFKEARQLYILIYIATEAHFNEQEWERFANSLNFQ
jgi:hypothetical protein